MNNLMELQSQIEKLQKQAAEIRSKEFVKTVAQIRAQMQAFGITVKDLQTAKKVKSPSTSAKKSVKPAGKKISGATVAAKYRGPEGQTWSGRGLSPRWMKALLDQGRSKEEFVITG